MQENKQENEQEKQENEQEQKDAGEDYSINSNHDDYSILFRRNQKDPWMTRFLTQKTKKNEHENYWGQKLPTTTEG